MIKVIDNTSITIFDGQFTRPELYQLEIGNVCIFSVKAPDKETPNEDAVAIIPVNSDAVVLVVADGLGGLPAGEAASRLVIKELVKALRRASANEIHIRGAILDGIEHANKKILDMKSGSATTLAVAEIQDGRIRTYHAGDSLIMLIGNRGRIKYSAIPHSPTGYARESGMIDESEAMQHEEKHLISNCIGSTDMRVEIGPSMDLAARDTLVLASDGLSDNLYDGEIVEATRKGPLISAAQRLINESRDNMEHPKEDRMSHPDDLSFLLFRLATDG